MNNNHASRKRGRNGLLEGHEKTLLAHMMSGHGACDKFLHRFPPDVFSVPHHRTIVDAIRDARGEGDKLNHITISNRLNGKKLAECGGLSGIIDIATATTSEEIAESALECVLDDYRARKASQIAKQLFEGQITAAEAQCGLAKLDESGEDDRLPRVQDAAEVTSVPIVLPDDVIEGLLSVGGKMVLGGGSKSFKTWQLIDAATAVATGGRFMGCATKQGRVLYINLELQSGFFAHRVKTICDHKSISIPVGAFDIWNLRGHAQELRLLLPEILKQAGNGKYVLIILDPIYKVLGEREENVTHHVTAIMNDLERIAVESGAAVAFGAHFSKGNQSQKESIDRLGGSGAFARDPDCVLTFTKHEEADAFTVEATLRNHAPIEPFVVRWAFPMMRRDDELDPARLKQVGGRPPRATEEQLLSLLDEKPLRSLEWQRAADKKLRLGERAFFNMLADIKESGRVLQAAGFYSRIPDK